MLMLDMWRLRLRGLKGFYKITYIVSGGAGTRNSSPDSYSHFFSLCTTIPSQYLKATHVGCPSITPHISIVTAAASSRQRFILIHIYF